MKTDWFLVAGLLLLATLGVLVQVRLAGSIPDGFILPLTLGGVAGISAAFGCAGGRAAKLLRAHASKIAWGIAFLLMAALLVFGRKYRGGLYLPGRINPSELVKLCMVVFVAARLSIVRECMVEVKCKVRGKSRGRGRGKSNGRGSVKSSDMTPVMPATSAPSARSVFVSCCLVGVVAAEVVLAGDFGLLAQLALTVAAVLFASSWAWGTAAFAAIGAGAACVSAYPTGHLATRFAVWRDPLTDATGAGWQTLQSLSAVVSGGVWGQGFGMGEVESVPIVSSDFVFAALAEDTGLAGCAAVLALWGLVFVRGIIAAVRQAQRGERGVALLAAGIVCSLAVQVILNVAGVLNVLPMTGIPLPLISHGGSSLAVTLAMCGILCGVTNLPKETNTLDKRTRIVHNH